MLGTAYQFTAGRTYQVGVTVVVVGDGAVSNATTASVTVHVISGAVVALISGGKQQQITNDAELDGSASFDENRLSNVGLRYSWTCAIASPIINFGNDCSAIFRSDLQASKIAVRYSSMNVSRTFTAEGDAVGHRDGRSLQQCVRIVESAAASDRVHGIVPNLPPPSIHR